MSKKSSKRVSSKRLAVKVGGLGLAAVGLIILGIGLAAHTSAIIVALGVALMLAGLVCMASPDATAYIIEMVLSWLP